MKTITIATIMTVFLFVSCSQIQDEQKAARISDSLNKIAKDSSRFQNEKTLDDFLKKQIDLIDNKFTGEHYWVTNELIDQEILLFNSWIVAIVQADASQNDSLKSLAAHLKESARLIFKSEFPKMRVAYAKNLAKIMWEHDIYVTATGSRNINLNMTGGYFSLNANIKDAEGTLEPIAKKLRFKKVLYRWDKIASEYTYYDLKTFGDDELIISQ